MHIEPNHVMWCIKVQTLFCSIALAKMFFG